MAISFQDALRDALARTGQNLGSLADFTGVDSGALELVLAEPSACLDLHDAKKVADFFGVALADFLEAPELKDPIEIADLYNQLPEHLKAQFRAYRPEPTGALNRPGQE